MERTLTAEQIARMEEAKRKVIARNDAEIERNWREIGEEPVRLPDGRAVSVQVAKMMGLRRPTQQAAE